MSVQTEINRIKANVQDSYTAVQEAGMDVTIAKTSGNLPTAISIVIDDLNALLDNLNGVVL